MKTKQQKLRITALLIFTVLFNFLFWQEKPGINYAIYILPILGLMIMLKPTRLKNIKVALALAGTLLSLGAIILLNSSLSIWMCFISLVLFVGFYYQDRLESIYYGISASVVSFVSTLFVFKKSLDESTKESPVKLRSFKKLKLAIIPILITAVFFLIYSNANPIIAEYSSIVFEKIGNAFGDFFENFSFARIMFVVLGLWISSFFLFFKNQDDLATLEESQNNTISRLGLKLRFRLTKNTSSSFNLISLFNEYRTALLTLILLNLLILLVNTIDVYKVWFNFSFEKGMNLSEELHSGTYLLILSILLSIGVIVYFFRGNINFLQKNKPLKIMAYVWIVQNFILAITVVVKCMYYINFHGLAYKRIGVLMFLAVVFFGLVIMLVKINKQKSVFYLLRKGTWFAYLLLCVAALINWDAAIIKTNINHQYPENIDYSFLVDLSDKSLPILLNNMDNIEAHDEYCIRNHKVNAHFYGKTLTSIIEKRIMQFNQKQHDNSWLSWNYADHKTAATLKLITNQEN